MNHRTMGRVITEMVVWMAIAILSFASLYDVNPDSQTLATWGLLVSYFTAGTMSVLRFAEFARMFPGALAAARS